MGFNMLSECLKNVFSWLEDDKVTLYSSILVNRTWCRTATPYLWKNPFKLVSHENVYKLICIYFKSMSNEIFIDGGDDINLYCLQGKLILKDKTNLISFIRSTQANLFDYISFFRVYNCYQVNNLINLWCSHFITDEKINWTGQRKFCSRWISSSLFRIIMDHSSRLDSLILVYDDFHFNEIDRTTFIATTTTITSSNSVISRKLNSGYTKLKSLHLDYCCDGHTLDCISKNCRTIEELWISLAERTTEIKPLCDLITSQKSLKDFRIRSSTMIMEYYFNMPDALLEALETHKDSLTTLQFFCCQFYQCRSFKPISECRNLKRLGFFNCEGMTHSKIFHLAAKGNLPKLEVLAIAVYDEFSSDVIIGMIKNSHNTLKRVSLPMATPDNGINHVMNAMKSFCYENLRGITVNFMAGDINNFENFLSLLEKCQNLERICIEGGDFEGFPLDFDSEEMSLKFRKLTKKLPKKLYKLVFYNVSIKPSLLLSFLKDLQSSSPKVLGFYECPLFEDLHIEMIIEYVQDPNNALENLIINWCDFITENIINRARQYIKKVDFSDIEPHEMEFTAWLE